MFLPCVCVTTAFGASSSSSAGACSPQPPTLPLSVRAQQATECAYHLPGRFSPLSPHLLRHLTALHLTKPRLLPKSSQSPLTQYPTLNFHIRPYPLENSGSRPLSHRQASEGQTSSWVGDDQRIPGVVCLFAVLSTFFLLGWM